MIQLSKTQVLSTIEKMPDNIDIEDLMYKFYVMDKINSGKESLRSGKSKTADELLAEIETW